MLLHFCCSHIKCLLYKRTGGTLNNSPLYGNFGTYGNFRGFISKGPIVLAYTTCGFFFFLPGTKYKGLRIWTVTLSIPKYNKFKKRSTGSIYYRRMSFCHPSIL